MRRIVFAVCLFAVAGTSGCTLMPESLQPHQLWKLNRQPASGRDDAFFSVSDPFLDSEAALAADEEEEGVAFTRTAAADTDWESDPF